MSKVIQCRQCRVEKACMCWFEPSTVASERLASNKRSALCKICHLRQKNYTEDEIDAELKEVAFEIRNAQKEIHARP